MMTIRNKPVNRDWDAVDAQQRMLEQVPQAVASDDLPTWFQLLTGLAGGLQEVEDELQDRLDAALWTEATGDDLVRIGRLVGVDFPDDDDDHRRFALAFAAAARAGRGTLASVGGAFQLLVDEGYAVGFDCFGLGTANVRVQVRTPDSNRLPTWVVQVVNSNLDKLPPAGVSINWVETHETADFAFGMAWSDGYLGRFDGKER